MKAQTRKLAQLPSGLAVFRISEAAWLTQMSPRHLTRLFDRGSLPGFRIGTRRDRRISRDTLINFMIQHGLPLDICTRGDNRIAHAKIPQDMLR